MQSARTREAATESSRGQGGRDETALEVPSLRAEAESSRQEAAESRRRALEAEAARERLAIQLAQVTQQAMVDRKRLEAELAAAMSVADELMTAAEARVGGVRANAREQRRMGDSLRRAAVRLSGMRCLRLKSKLVQCDQAVPGASAAASASGTASASGAAGASGAASVPGAAGASAAEARESPAPAPDRAVKHAASTAQSLGILVALAAMCQAAEDVHLVIREAGESSATVPQARDADRLAESGRDIKRALHDMHSQLRRFDPRWRGHSRLGGLRALQGPGAGGAADRLARALARPRGGDIRGVPGRDAAGP
jgi:hypothetical protein